MTDTSSPTALAVLTATLAGHARVGETSDFRFRFTDARTGIPVTDLQPCLGRPGTARSPRPTAPRSPGTPTEPS